MDGAALASTMMRLAAWLDAKCSPAGLVQCRFDEAPLGTSYVSIAPDDDSPYASANNNRIYLCGADGGLTAEGIARLAGFFGTAGVDRFFVWLSPGPNMGGVRAWLAAAGLERVPYVAYPTLARDAGEPSPIATDLEVREVGAAEIARLAGRLDKAAWPIFVRSAGADGLSHFLAFDGDTPVASAALAVFEGVGYLGMAFTAEQARRRGAQRALIAKRMEKARAIGCRMLVSETLSIVPISLGNLQKAGFQTVYEKEVYSNRIN